MSKIYTRTGDAGDTGLWGGERVRKDQPRVRAYGDVDELNSAVGAALASFPRGTAFAPLQASLARIQEELFVVGALLATPPEKVERLGPPFSKGLPPDAAARLEREIDRLESGLEPLKKFILPGGALPGALLHFARTVCRRAEREVVSLAAAEPVPAGLIVYLNRLSDFLFVAARWANRKARRRETQWRGL